SKGPIWQFKTEPVAYPIPGSCITATASNWQDGFEPSKTIDSSGLDPNDGDSTSTAHMWQTESGASKPVWIQYSFDKVYKLYQLIVWNYNADLEFLVGFGIKDVTIQYSLDGTTWSVLGDWTLQQATSRPGYKPNNYLDLHGIYAQHIRLTVKSGYGPTGRYGLSEVRFLYIPTYPRLPQPPSGATAVDTDLTLSWRPGRTAVSHRLFISTEQGAVETELASPVELATASYRPGNLLLGQTYYWKVVEVNAAEAISCWAGPVWRFTTQAFYLVDGFETYTDDKQAHQAIWQTWVDGYGTQTNGSQVGHSTPPYAERNIVHRGWQAMPFYYNNSNAPLSEATRTFTPAQDWTSGGARYLALYLRGSQANTVGRLYVRINDALVTYDGDPSDLTKPFWILWSIDLSKINTDLRDVRTMTIGMDNSGSGTLYVDDIRLYRIQPAQGRPEVWIEAEDAESITWPMRVYSDRPDASSGRYIAVFGDNSSSTPSTTGRASYTLRLEAGTYMIIGRAIAPTSTDDSFWVLLEGATTNTTNHVSGWIRWGLDLGEGWHEVPISSMDDNDQTVLFTIPGGLYNLQIAFREDGALLDALRITKVQ
ncbi:MAG: discoidin domain-containing protein, partial [Sedimentisphaerales bacterium]|nr:discoidin domain-containing protein [Sedimentisphaerales bacterium]